VAASASGGSTPWAQGGLAAAIGSDDSAALHAADTLGAGAGLVDELVAKVVTEGAAEAIAWLVDQGARFDRDERGELVLGREAAHSRQRIVHAKDATGSELARALTAACAADPATRLVTDTVAIDLLVAEGGVAGVLARDNAAGELVAYLAPAVVLATGGYAHLWAATTTPPQATGDGVAMAARAGVALADLELVQFHPTALASGADPRPLLTEALRGEGATLVDESGERFTFAADPAGELAPRDVVARAIYRHLAAGHEVHLDAREAVGERFPERFPTVFALAQADGLDPRRDLLPVSPAAHYCMGGVAVGPEGRTTLPGLWAAGEVASTGLHGANRLASNSLLEGVVMGRRVAADIAARGGGERALPLEVLVPEGAATLREDDPAAVVPAVRRLLWQRVGLERDEAGLRSARAELDRLAPAAAASRPARNAVLVAGLVVDAALARRESRGAHFRTDHPDADPTAATRRTTQPAPVPFERWRLEGASLVPAALATVGASR
jgi:L-aspartate oxidase